jgi:hypothetical protein
MHKTGIGYEKEVTFHILDYTKPIKFQSVGFIQKGSYSPGPVQRAHSEMPTLSASWPHGRLVLQSSSLQALQKAQSSFRQMFQTQEICKSKEPLWVDDFLAMVINRQEDISVISMNSFSSIDASYNERICIFSPCT